MSFPLKDFLHKQKRREQIAGGTKEQRGFWKPGSKTGKSPALTYSFVHTHTKPTFGEHTSVPGPVWVFTPGERQSDLGLRPAPARLED